MNKKVLAVLVLGACVTQQSHASMCKFGAVEKRDFDQEEVVHVQQQPQVAASVAASVAAAAAAPQDPWAYWGSYVQTEPDAVKAGKIETFLLTAYVVRYLRQRTLLSKERGDTLTYDSFQKQVSRINGEDGSSTQFFTITRLSQEDAEKLCKDLQYLFLQKRQSNADDGGILNSLTVTVHDIFKIMEKLVCEASN